ncbi:ribonuclease inhibitor [Deinococcus roseus]|nr:ribonuclease inhibitor [Deinococcus roseus]
MEEFPIHCPVQDTAHDLPYPAAELQPLLNHLLGNHAAPQRFPRGTVTEDGRLDLCKQDLGVEGCRHIKEALLANNVIHTLLLGTDAIGDEGVAMVAELVAQNSTLHTLYLGCNHITEAGMHTLGEAIAAQDHIEALWLKRNPIGEGGAKAVASMLQKTPSLKVLDLVQALPDRKGLTDILEVLIQQNRTVERLHLGGNHLGPAEAEQLAQVLKANPTLRSLMLGVGQLGDEGAIVLAEALQHNTTLQELGLASNGIGKDGARVLLQTLKNHPSLEVLDLGYAPSTRVLNAQGNVLGDRLAPELGQLLQHNTTLRRLDVTRTGLTLQSLPTLQAALQENHTLLELQVEKALLRPLMPLLERNRAQAEPWEVPAELQRIRSVYRTRVL